MKKGLFVLFLGAVLVSMAFAGGSQEGAATGARAADDQVVPITYLYSDSDTAKFPKDADRPNIALLKEIARDRFGIDWQLEPVMGSRMDTVFNTRLAARNLPDMIDYRLDQNRLVEVYQQGHIIRLNDLVDDYGPRIKELMYVQDPYLWIANGDAEGNLLRYTRQVANIQHRMRVICINLDWLDALGMAVPSTTDELYEALVAFRENDMNNNGLKDEIASGFLQNYHMSFSNSFGVKDMTNAANSFYADENGKVYHTMLSREAYDYFAFMAKMAEAGVLDKEIINQTGDQYNQKRFAYRVSMFPDAFWGPVTMDSAVRSKGHETAEYWQMIPPAVAPGVSPSVTVRQLGGYNGYMITSASLYPDRITRLIDWAMTVEGSQQEYYGATSENPGDYYFVQTEYKGYPLANYSLGPTAKYHADLEAEPLLRQKLGINTGLLPHMLYGTPGDVAQGLEANWSTVSGRGSNFESNIEKLRLVEEEIGIPGFAMAAPTAQQSAVFEEYSDLFLYIDEMTQKFIIGAESLSRWDAFLAQAERQGLREVLQVVQDRYDAYVRIMSQ